MLKYVTDINNNLYIKESLIKEKKVNNNINNKIIINIDNIITKYLGMGGALTESVAYNYSVLSKKNKQNFINDCYSSNGLNYKYARISIGSCDFSLSYYSYAKKRDLSDFNINHDKEYVIPLINDILKKKMIDIIASPWTPPTIFKRFRIYKFSTKLLKRYYQDYSNYLIKYIDAYQKENISISYITMQNEPLARQKWESCKFNIHEQRNFIYNFLLPKLTNTKLLLHDHNKDNLFNVFKSLYQENDKIKGIAFHNYSGRYFNELKKIRDNYQNIMLINTEGCTGYSKYDEKSWIGDAEYYLDDIIGDFNNGTNAYLDWNILLNEEGGPFHIKNPVKSMLILSQDNYIKTPIYYYLYHISHFVNIDMNIIGYNSMIKDINIVAFSNINKLVIVIMNKKDIKYQYNIIINNQYISDYINPHSIITYVQFFDKKASNN